MALTSNHVQLSDLNNWMKNYASGVIVQEDYQETSFYEVLRGNVERVPHVGDYVEMLIQDTRPFTAKAHGEDADIPYPDDLSFQKVYVPLREVIVNAGLTRQALDRAVGGDASWGRIVDRVLSEQKRDFMWLMEVCSIGNGTGMLARVKSAANNGSVTTVTCDNTYTDFGWDNVALMKPGMLIEIYASDGTTKRNINSEGYARVTSVTFGDRNNGAAQDGTFTYASAGVDAVADNDVVYIYGAKSEGLGVTSKYVPEGPFPMGLTGIVQGNGDDYAGSADMTTFQGLVRANYPTLQSTVYQATDYDSTYSDGTPNDWSLSLISDAISQVKTSTGGLVNLLVCSSELAMAIHRKNRAETGFSVTVGDTGRLNQNAVGSQYANSFLCPDGRIIPIKVSETCPENVLYGLTTDDLTWYVKGKFDYLRLNGQVWDKSYNDRKTNFEAPYGGYTQIGAERCDRCFCMQDLATNV